MIRTMDFPLVIRDMAQAAGRDTDSAATAMGDEEFRLFYERTARPLWAYLSRITGDPQQADDLLQESFFRVYRAGSRYENEAHRRNSLYQIATNLARDVVRRNRRHTDVALQDDDSPAALPAGASASPAREVAIRTDLAKAMQELDPLQRELLWLAYAQGASHEEIASVLGLKAISIRTLLLRARRKAASILERRGRTTAQETHP